MNIIHTDCKIINYLVLLKFSLFINYRCQIYHKDPQCSLVLILIEHILDIEKKFFINYL